MRHLLTLLLLLPCAALAEVPVLQQGLVLFKVVSYDRNLEQGSSEPLIVGVVFGDGQAAEAQHIIDALTELATQGLRVAGRPVEITSIPWASLANGEATLRGVRALYVVPGLGTDLSTLTTLTREQDVLTVSPSEAEVAEGIAIGIVSDGPRASLVIHLAAIKEEGVNLPASLLRMSTVLR